MQLFMQLKYSFNRNYFFSLILINMREISILSVLLVATFAPFYHKFFQIITFVPPYSTSISTILAIFNTIIVLLTVAPIWSKLSLLKPFWIFSTIFIKIFPYVLLVPTLTYSLGSIAHNDLLGSAVGIVNIIYILSYILLHEYLNESLKFKELDYCNRRLVSFSQQLIMVASIAATQILGSYYGCLVIFFRSIFILGRLFDQFEYKLIQRLYIFYTLLQSYIALVIVMGQIKLIDASALLPVPNSLFVIFGGTVVSWALSRQISIHIYQKLLERTHWGGQRGEGESSNGRQYNKIQYFENQIKILVQVILQKWKFQEDKQNDYEYYWKVYNQRVFVHKLRCQQKHCVCKNKKYSQQELDQQIYVFDILQRVRGVGTILGKEGRLKVLNINLLVQIAKRPLKGYYELISVKRQKNKQALMFQIEDLVIRARECFDQIYYKNKVQNQQLDLMKSIQCQQIMTTLEEELRSTLLQTAAFLQIFTYSTVKITQVQSESRKLFQAKKSIQTKIQKMIWLMGQSVNVSLALFVFYRMLQVYRSRQNQFKKLSGQQSLKKRLMQKAQGQAIGEEQGIIYIDLVEERGRIKKITMPISDFFGYSKEDMIGFNINLFMPSLFGKYHARFLSNFIDKGRIKLLKERNRVVFGKNKKKFIFPINVKLKTEHLQHDQFGASALITKIDTNSEFIIAGTHARVEEVSEGLYRRIFGKSLKEDVGKLNKLCLYKLILGLNQVTQNWQQKFSSKIHEGLIIFAERDDYLMEKFRYNRESTYSSINNKTKSLNSSTNSITSTSLPVDSKSERFEYFSQLFKGFLLDINPKRLRAIKINYKYSRMQTSQFQIELVEIINIKDELQGKIFQRELINELNNVAQVYQLLDQHSPLSKHLAILDQEVQKTHQNKRKTIQPKQLTLGFETAQNQNRASYNTNKELPSQGSEESFQEGSQEKLQFNPQMSQQSSLVGNTESQSKKQLLINAFNSTESALPAAAIFLAYLSLLILLVLLISLSYFSYAKANHDRQLWNDITYILNMRKIVEFRLSMIELDTFSRQLNTTLPQSLLNKTMDLNGEMVQLVKNLNALTFDNSRGGPYSFIISLYDPNRNITYEATIPQLFSQLTWLFQHPSQNNIKFLRVNYQNIHLKIQQFYILRYSHLQNEVRSQFETIRYLFGFYQSLLIITALCSLPLYIYFKREELTVRSKLGYMNAKQIKKSISKLRFTYDFLRNNHKKGAVTRLQMELSDKRGQKQDQAVNANKTTKITSQAQQSKLFKNPILYILLLAFIVFFSNLSCTLFVVSDISDNKFIEAISANKLFYEMQMKIPLLANTYLANLNNVLQNNTLSNISNQLIDQAQKGYFDIISELTQPTYTNTPLSQQISTFATNILCSQVACSSKDNFSLQFISNSFKNRFNYWIPSNGITANYTSIMNWVSQNKIVQLLGEVQYVLQLSSIVKIYVQQHFAKSLNQYLLIIIILASILIPVNTAIMVFISYNFLNLLNGIIKSAEEVFMHFPVNVLIENTYLTSYFNSKAKHGK